MPIMLDDLSIQNQKALARTYSPKFFDNVLTGAGKTAGILNQGVNPQYIPQTKRTLDENINTKKRKYTNGNTTMQFIPFYIVGANGWGSMQFIDVPPLMNMKEIGKSSDGTVKVYTMMLPHSFILETVKTNNWKTGKNDITKTPTTTYQLFTVFVTDGSDNKAVQLYNAQSAKRNSYGDYTGFNGGTSKNAFITEFSANPLLGYMNIKDDLIQLGYNIDDKMIWEFINDYDTYGAICERSKTWQEDIHTVLDTYFEQVAATPGGYGSVELNEVVRVLQAIEDYNIPLDLYRDIYDSIIKHFKTDEATILCKQNLNLLLSDTLHSLDKNRQQLTKLPHPNSAIIDPMFSKEQAEAITSSEPLVMVQSGAGTGKSTVVLGRIKYMMDAGVDPKDITVLSFTNAAANNIADKNPGVNSMTIAKMIHEIYSLNFPKHELSTVDTVINSLDIYFPNNDFAINFKRRLNSIGKNDSDAFTRMNNFIEKHYDQVMQTLDIIKQTTLELEIIICYQRIEHLIEPPQVQSKYLIIDEVQDNSIFEFIYTVKYVDKHLQSLFIVGDSSQTLYEFRASNPKALNVLEGSGIFTTHKLQTNYRSNQEILDFANVALSDIEANQYANIQLRANKLNPVDLKSFTDKVNLHYAHLNRIKDLNTEVSLLFKRKVKDYIDECLARGEQVAFLAYTRRHVQHMQELLSNIYPTKQIANLVPEKMYNGTIFSAFIKKYWDEVQFVPPGSIMSVVIQAVYHRLDFLVYNANQARPHVQSLASKWFTEEKAHIDAWQAQYMNGTMSLQDFLENVKTNMLHFEIRNNAIKQSMLSARNEENKRNQQNETADFLLSTIHSAKGLEFDNVVVLYQNNNNQDEEKKRMYYVAFTRAMNTEFILTVDTVLSPKIVADYENIIKTLEAKENGTMSANVLEDGSVVIVEEPSPDNVTAMVVDEDGQAENPLDTLTKTDEDDTS